MPIITRRAPTSVIGATAPAPVTADAAEGAPAAPAPWPPVPGPEPDEVRTAPALEVVDVVLEPVVGVVAGGRHRAGAAIGAVATP